jgi:hypothetical protein
VGLRAGHHRGGPVQLKPVGRDPTPAFGRDRIAKRLARPAEAPAMSTASLPMPAAPTAATPSVSPAARPSASATSARTLFRIRFASAMSDEDADRLRDALDMALHLHPKHPAVRPPLGVAPLPFGGLFLVRGEGEREWALEGRTWASPSAAAVREAELEAILAARRLDPSVSYPMPPRRRPRAPEQRPPHRSHNHHARHETSGAAR